MKIQYFILAIAIITALVITGPVAAYSIRVYDTPVPGEKDLTRTIQSSPGRIQATRSLPVGAAAITSGANSIGSIGSASAFSEGLCESQTTHLEFSNSVSVQGIINNFVYSARYDSSVFR